MADLKELSCTRSQEDAWGLSMPQRSVCLTTHIFIKPNSLNEFVSWQTKFHTTVTAALGFVSLEIFLSEYPSHWRVLQRFVSEESLKDWLESDPYQQLLKELKAFLIEKEDHLSLTQEHGDLQPHGVTEVFIAEVNLQQEKAYQDWMAKIHQAEAKFPGFKGVYIQPLGECQDKRKWMTFLHFDSAEHLDGWIASSERQMLLRESAEFVHSLEGHRLASPFAGWFASFQDKGVLPAAWKQTLIVLLVLFPIVMLEFKYLSPLTQPLNLSLATFIGNALSVALIAWPLTPLAGRLLGWWLIPNQKRWTSILGTLLVLTLYILEVLLFWH